MKPSLPCSPRVSVAVIACVCGWLASIAVARAAPCANYASAHAVLGEYFPGRKTFYLRDSDGSGAVSEVAISDAQPDWLPIAGKWQAGGYDSVGLYDPKTSYFHLKNATTSGPTDTAIWYGSANGGWVPLAGDWTKKGYASIGLYNRSSGAFYLKNSNTGGAADIVLPFGTAGDAGIPIVGDWVGDGISRVGLYEPATGMFLLRLTNNPNDSTSTSFRYGGTNSPYRALAGRFNPSSATDTMALYKGSVLLERYVLGGGAADLIDYLAPTGVQNGVLPIPVMGRWQPTRCLSAGQNTSPQSPSWVKDAIVYELRIETFSEGAADGGYFRAATALLPQLQDLGVSVVSLNPIAAGPFTPDVRGRNLYSAAYPDAIDPQLGPESDFVAFVAKAHSLGISVVVDNVVHGIAYGSPYVSGPGALPADFFSHDADGSVSRTTWGTAALDWTSHNLRDWWTWHIGLPWVQSYGVDGFRMDLEPGVAGPALWGPFRAGVLQYTNKQIALLPESSPSKRAYLYDLGEGDTGISSRAGDPGDFYDGSANLVDTIKASPENFYSNQISSHGSADYQVKGRLSAFAYGSVLSPYSPRFFMGEEFNATANQSTPGDPLYFSQLHWAQKTANLAFYNRVKKLIQLRKQYANVFSTNGGPLSSAKITKVTQYAGVDLEPYAMWSGNLAITVVAKRATANGTVSFTTPVDKMGMSAYPWFRVTDLMTGAQSFYTSSQFSTPRSYPLNQGDVLVQKTEGIQPPDIQGYIDRVTSNGDGSYTVYGWICAQYADVSLGVHLYLGNSDGSGQHYYTSGTANLPSEAAVATVCQASGTNYRFALRLGADAIAAYAGQTIFVHGLSPFGLNNYAITQPHYYQVP